jgi:hypothetical protein
MLKTDTIKFSDKGVTADLVIHEATIRHSIQRGMMSVRANSDNPDEASAAIEGFTFMSCMGAAEGSLTYDDPPKNLQPEDYVEGALKVGVGSLSFSNFIELPAELGDEWTRKTYELNPDWRAGARRRKRKELGETTGGDEK